MSIDINSDNFLGLLKVGDNQAFAALAKKAFPIIKAHVTANSGNNSDAEDLMQSSLMSLYLNIKNDRYNQNHTLVSYLVAIARNQWLGQLRKTKRRNESGVDLSLVELEDPGLVYSNNTDKFDLLYEKINQLPANCREIIRLSALKGKKLKDIAEENNWSYNGLKTKKSKCIKQLKSLILNDESAINILKGIV